MYDCQKQERSIRKLVIPSNQSWTKLFQEEYLEFKFHQYLKTTLTFAALVRSNWKTLKLKSRYPYLITKWTIKFSKALVIKHLFKRLFRILYHSLPFRYLRRTYTLAWRRAAPRMSETTAITNSGSWKKSWNQIYYKFKS